MNSDKIQALINDYLVDKISDKDSDALKKEAEVDRTVLEDIKLSKMIVSGMRVQEKNNLKAEFSDMLLNVPEKQKGKSYSFIYYAVAAAITLVITATIIILSLTYGPKSDELFISYYRPLTISSSERGENTAQLSAEKYYNLGDYSTAATEFEKIRATRPNDKNALILLVNCYLNIDQVDSAIELLTNVADNNNSEYADYYSWYLSLAYLKSNQIEECKDQLNIIVSKNMIHASKAKNLLNDLN